MPRKPKAVERQYGPEKRFFTTVTIRALEEDKARWEAAAQKTPERLSLSEAIRGAMNRWAEKVLGASGR